MFYLLEQLVLHQCHIDSVKGASASSSVELRRLAWVGPLTVLASIAGVLIVRLLAIALLRPSPAFVPLNIVLTIVDTSVLVTLAVWVFKRVVALALDPISTYKIIASKALLLSFLPDIALALAHLPAATWPIVCALMAEHVAAWAVCVPMLTELTRADAVQASVSGKGQSMRLELSAFSVYNDRLNERRRSLRQLVRWAQVLGYMRGAAGLLIVATLWLVFVPHLVEGWVTLIPVLAFAGLDRYYEALYRKLNRAHRAVAFYESGIARMEDRWMGTGITDTKFSAAGHVYANDLDLFGEGSLFELLCTARTRSGQETLARWLCTPASRYEILRRQEAITELRNNLDLREELATFGPDRAAIDCDLLEAWAVGPVDPISAIARIVAPILVVCTIGAGYWYWFSGGTSLLMLAVAAQVGFALRHRRRVVDSIAAIQRPAGELSLLFSPLARLEREPFLSPKLSGLKNSLRANTKSASQRVGSIVSLVALLDYRQNPSVGLFLPAFLWSTQVALATEAWRDRHRGALLSWMETVGEFEALCALGGYAFEHPGDPFPEILEGETRFDAKDLRHPLLPRSQCVPNSLCLDAELQLLVVSGSNMSGKSTLLRTVGINLILAQTGAPVRAQRLTCSSPMAIGAALRVQDSLQRGTSRFYAEIRRLNEIMNLAEQRCSVLFLLDEILHGTNSHDRTIGAEAVLRGLVECGAIGLVTTHDLALAAVADGLGSRATNVHFRDHIEEGQMVFDYLLHQGVIQKSNALELMRAVGLKI